MCSFKAVVASNKIHQRKILAILECNYFWGKPPTSADLGRRGASSLVNMISPLDELRAAAFDRESCFTYVETPQFWRAYHSCPLLSRSAA
jgi:hypothetical protein